MCSQTWSEPQTVQQVQSFLRLVSYYQKFIDHFSDRAAPLTALTQKGASWSWHEAQKHAFADLKAALTSAPVLIYPDPAFPYIVTTDASDVAVGAVLQQDRDHGRQPIAFFSRKLKGAELNWATYEKETLAQVLALKEWRWCLEGTPFVLETDHEPLKYLQTQVHLSRKQARWLEHFQLYNFSVRHISDPFIKDARRKLQEPGAAWTVGDSGHQGVQRTLYNLQLTYYWPKMVNDITIWIRSCDTCQRVKAPRHKGNTAVLVFTDKLTRMIHLASTKDTCTAMDAADLYLRHVYRLHGLPHSIKQTELRSVRSRL